MNLLETINKNENMRKLFGKRELIIIQKQLLGVKLTQSEKNRLSRDIRRKFEAIRQLSQFSQEFELKYGSNIKEIISETKEIILGSKYKAKIKRIIIYGSTADNTRTLSSDIDIAVEFNEISKEEATKFRLDIVRKANEKVDIQVFNILPEKIKNEINIKGKVLYEQQNKR